MIPFSVPYVSGKEKINLHKLLEIKKFQGDGIFTKKCSNWIENQTKAKKVLLTTSCTHALEMSALLTDIKNGDEVIMPSYTFVSTANSFVLRGATIVFVDIRPDTMNIDEKKIEAAITPRTKVIVPVNYAGVACEMDTIMKIADNYNLLVVEDNAQGAMASYKGRALGSIGNLGCLSFHETKNFQCGEGGAILINDHRFMERAVVIREKGTNRARFLLGLIDKYSWVDIGSSYLPSELNAAFLFAQFSNADEINKRRSFLWQRYLQNLMNLGRKGLLTLPGIPSGCTHNAHLFYIRLKNREERRKMINFLKEKGIESAFHFIPLHLSDAGRKYGRFNGSDEYTTQESEKLLRLPLYFSLTIKQVDYICEKIGEFFNG